MKILLDTNIIVSDFKMNSLSFQILFENSKKGNEQLYIPMIVKEETINKFRQRLKDVLITTNREIRIYNDLTGNKFKPLLNDEEVEFNVNEYENCKVQLKSVPLMQLKSVPLRIS
jgi:predicted nucleic acid-binding protein